MLGFGVHNPLDFGAVPSPKPEQFPRTAQKLHNPGTVFVDLRAGMQQNSGKTGSSAWKAEFFPLASGTTSSNRA